MKTLKQCESPMTTQRSTVSHSVRKEAAASGTPHLQGYVWFAKQTSMRQALKLCCSHKSLKAARFIDKSIEHCKKGGDWEDHGLPPNVATKPGQRTDLEPFKDVVKSGIRNHAQLREDFSDVCACHPQFVRQHVQDKVPVREVPCHPLCKWQQDLNDMLKRPPDKRTIYFCCDVKGNTGKSWFTE